MNTPIHLIIKGINNIYMKREDFIPFSFGGNKARKAFYFFKEIERLGCDCVVTYGSSSSNHCRVVANMAASRNLECIIIGPKEASEPTYNSQMMYLFGAEIITVPVNEVHDTIENKLTQLKNQGKTPYFIEGGGHGNWGTQAFVDCYNEIKEYEHDQNVHFDYVFFASGTGTTQAGLVCGQLIYNDIRKIVGVSIARRNPRGREVVLNSIKDYLCENKITIDDDKISESTVFIDDYICDGYGKSTKDIKNIIQMMLVKYGIPMDATYTAKAYTGMINYLSSLNIQDANVLFIHTGGTPLFFDSLK